MFDYKAEALEDFYVEPTRGFLDSNVIYKKGSVVEVYRFGLKRFIFLGYGRKGVKCFAPFLVGLLKRI